MLSRQGTPDSEVKVRLGKRNSDQQLLTGYSVSIFHSPGDGSESTTDSKPFGRRWLSASKIPDSTSSMETFSGSSKKFWSVRLSRLNTRTSTLKAEPVSDVSRVAPSHVRKRSEQFKARQRIVLASVDSGEAPPIIKAAQAGSRSKVEAMLDKGENIETCHLPTKRTALAVACHCGNTGMVELLINRAAKLNARDMDLSTPLHLAASRGHLGAAALLLDELVGIESRDNRKRTPLWVAAEGGHIKVVELLLNKGARVKTRAKDQLTPLHAAAKGGHVETVGLLLRHDSHIESRDVHFNTALHYACDYGHLPVVDLLVRKGADIESIGKDSRLPLTFAAASGHLEIVVLLSKKKASLQGTDDKERNALHYAAANGHVEVAEFLLGSKVSIHAVDAGGLTPIHQAVIASHFNAVEFLLKKNATLEVRCRAGRTPLHYACDSDNADIVRLLLGAGAKAEAEIRGDSRRPIHVAAARGSVETIGVLYQHGVAMDARDSVGHRPLSVACHHGHVDVVKTFLSLRQPLTMAFKDRPDHDSPLCVAAKAGHVSVVGLLIRRGATLNQRDEHGFTPLYYAAHYGRPQTLNILVNAGAEFLDDEADESLPMRDRIGFAKDVSEDRKHGVRELLLIAESKMSSRISSTTNSQMSFIREQSTDCGLIHVPEHSSLPTPHQPSTLNLPEFRLTTLEIPEKEDSYTESPKSPTSIFSAQSLRSKSSVASLFSTRSPSPVRSATSSPPTQSLPTPVHKPPPPPPPPASKFKPKSKSNLSPTFTSKNSHLSTLLSDGRGLKISHRDSSLRPARSMLLPCGFTRDNSLNRMSHVGDLMAKEQKVQELGGGEIYEMGKGEVYEMA
jgi:ankyrin repeat protein